MVFIKSYDTLIQIILRLNHGNVDMNCISEISVESNIANMYSEFIRQLNTNSLKGCSKEKKGLEKTISLGKRKQLQRKMLDLFIGEMEQLPNDLQQVLTDDLVTAFHNRLAVFIKIQSKPQLHVQFGEENIARIHK